MSLDPNSIANRAVREGHLTQEQLNACIKERRELLKQGLETPLRELLLERGLIDASKWDSLSIATVEVQETRSGEADTAVPALPTKTTKTAREPEVLGNYRILAELGRGAMGIVYEAVHCELDRRVALKILPETQALRGIPLERFLREARATAALKHPGIVPIYEIGEDRGVHHFAMELVEGRSLRQLIQDDVLPAPREVARIGQEVAEALHHAHETGVTHRDVKPDNILLRSDGKVVVTDFGLARHTGDQTLTIEGAIVGTPLYMSPEQARGEPTDRRSDVYGLGITLYELLCGKAPFQDATDSHRLLMRVADEDVPSILACVPSLPAPLAAIVDVATAKDPSRRFQTSAALAQDLARFLRSEPIQAVPPSNMERLWWRVRRRPQRVALVLGVLALTCAGAFGFQAVSSRGRADALFQAAQRAVLDGKSEAALRNLELALEENSDHLEARLVRGHLLRERGDLEGALRDFVAAQETDAADPRPLVEQAVTLFALGRSAEAVPLLRAALEPSQRVVATQSPAYGQAVLRMGEIEFAGGRYPQALAFLEEAVRMDPVLAHPRLLLARTLLKLGNTRAAAEAASEALRRDPENLETLELRGRAYRLLGRHDRALEDLEAARERPGARLERGLVLFESLQATATTKAFDHARVQADLESAVTDDTISTERRSLAHVVLAWLSLLAERPRRSPALRQLDRALELEPDSTLARAARAQLLLDWNKHAEALPDLERARDTSTGAYTALIGLARVALQQGDSARARDLLDEAIRSEPKRPSAYCYRYRLRLAAGDPAAAEDQRLGLAPPPPAEGPVVLTPETDLLHAAEQATEAGRTDYLASVNTDGALDRAEAWLRRARVLDSGSISAASLHASALYLLGRDELAVRAYTSGATLDPRIGEFVLTQAVIHRDLLEKPTLAESVLRKALEGAPAGDLRGRMQFELAKTLVAQSKQAEAVEVLEGIEGNDRHCVDALRLKLLHSLGRNVSEEEITAAAGKFYNGERDTTRSTLFTGAALRMRKLGDRKHCLHFLTRAIESDPSNALAWHTRSRVRFQGSPEQFPQGLADDFVAADLDPRYTAGMMALEARLTRFRHVMPMIGERADEILRGSPELPAAAWLKGYMDFLDGDYVACERWFERALRLSQGRSYISQAYLSLTRLRLGKLELAREDLLKAERIFPAGPQSLFLRACLHSQEGDRDAALAALGKLSARGYLFPEQVERAPELVPLLDDPRYKALVERKPE